MSANQRKVLESKDAEIALLLKNTERYKEEIADLNSVIKRHQKLDVLMEKDERPTGTGSSDWIEGFPIILSFGYGCFWLWLIGFDFWLWMMEFDFSQVKPIPYTAPGSSRKP